MNKMTQVSKIGGFRSRMMHNRGKAFLLSYFNMSQSFYYFLTKFLTHHSFEAVPYILGELRDNTAYDSDKHSDDIFLQGILKVVRMS